MSTLVRCAGTVAALVALCGACSDEPTTPNAERAELTIVHATKSLGALTVTVGDESVITGLAFGSASRPLDVPGGTQHVVVRAGAQIVGDFETDLSTAHLNAMVIANGAAQVASEVQPDTGSVAPTRANLRLVNVASAQESAPTALDILINAPGVGPDSTQRFGGLDSRVARYYSLLYYDPGHFRLRYVPAGTTNVLTEIEFDIAAGETKVAVLQRNGDGTYTVTVATESGT